MVCFAQSHARYERFAADSQIPIMSTTTRVPAAKTTVLFPLSVGMVNFIDSSASLGNR